MTRISVLAVAGAGLSLLVPALSHAFEIRTRWVERQGFEEYTLEGNILNAVDTQPHRVRFQIGVFDNAQSVAPAGGMYGWDNGSIEVLTPDPNESDDTRTPGRLAPFVSSSHPHANGFPPLPEGDPFELLTDIDATIGMQTRVWGFNPDGTPTPQPLPVVLGRNRFVSVFEITVDPALASIGYNVIFSGSLRAVTEWQVLGEPIPPDPDSGEPGSVTYFPLTTEAIEFESSLFVYVVPSPGAATVLVLGGLLGLRRRRSRAALLFPGHPPR